MTAPTDVEDLLRHTYREVAARTTVTGGSLPDNEVRLQPTATSPRPIPPLAAAAAIVSLLVGGLLLLARRDTSAPAADTALVHALAGRVPQVPLDDGGTVIFPVTGIVSTDDFDRITWSSDDGVVSIAVDRSGAPDRPTGETVRVRGGTVATRTTTAEGGALTWREGPGAIVAVEWSGDVTAELVEEVVAGMFFVDESVWNRAVATGGFGAEPRPAVLERTVDAGRSVGVELRGTIHDGFGVEIGNGGFSLPLDDCDVSIDFGQRVDGGRPTQYLVLGPRTVTAAEVSVDGEVVASVELVTVFAGVDLTLGTFELDRPVSADLPTAACSEARR